MKVINGLQKKVLSKIVNEVSKQNFIMLDTLVRNRGDTIYSMIIDADGDYDKFWQSVADAYNDYVDSMEVGL